MISRDRLPNGFDQILFQGKATVFRLRRWGRDRNPARPLAEGLHSSDFPTSELLAESISALWDRSATASEHQLQLGKIQNLRVASRRIDGCVVEADGSFSFWSQVGWPSRWRGFMRGRELRQGCLIPTVGGGLCQLSNALYDAALRANFNILERHAHTQVIPGSLAEAGRDATVFWNYIDLRFSSNCRFQIRIQMTSDELIVRFLGSHAK